MSISFPDTSASPYRDGNGTVWTWADGAWRRSASLPPAVVNATDAVVASLINDVSEARSAMDARFAKPARLSPMMFADKARTGQFRVALIGMSIASFSGYMPTLARLLKQQHGDAAAEYVDGGALGGSYTAPRLGWEKQKSYAPPRYTRLRGKAASTEDQRFLFQGDTLRLHFSVEADSEAANITVDGDVVGTTPAAGTQAFGVMQEFNLTSGPHEVTIARPSGAGYVYFESLEGFESARPGVITYNWTLGGSSLLNTRIAGSATGAQLAAPALASEHTGTDAWFDRDDIDLFIVQHDVNELHPTFYGTDFLPAFNRMIAKTRERPVPLVLVSSMAGHFAMPADQDYDNYADIRALYASTRATESHVEHVDWHAATVLDDLARYAALYYPNVTDLDVEAGTYTGDFIHPSNASKALFHLYTDVLHVPPTPTNNGNDFQWDHVRRVPTLGSSRARTTDQLELVTAGTVTFSDTTDVFTSDVAHGLSVGDQVIFYYGGAPTGSNAMPLFTPGFWWVVAVQSDTTFQLSATDGGAAFTQAGSSTRTLVKPFYKVVGRTYRNPVEGGALQHYAHGSTPGGPFLHVPIYRDDTVASLTNVIRNDIGTSVVSDEWGTYYNLASTRNVGLNQVACGQTFTDGKGCVMLFRFKGLLGIRAVESTFTKIITPDGQDCPLTIVSSGRTEATIENLSDEPIVMAVHLDSTSNTAAVTIVGSNTRIYEAATVYGTVPVWPADG